MGILEISVTYIKFQMYLEEFCKYYMKHLRQLKFYETC